MAAYVLLALHPLLLQSLSIDCPFAFVVVRLWGSGGVCGEATN